MVNLNGVYKIQSCSHFFHSYGIQDSEELVDRQPLENDVLVATAWFDNNYITHAQIPINFSIPISIILSRDVQQSLSISVKDNTILTDTL